MAGTAYTVADLTSSGDVVTETGNLSVTDPDNDEAEGGSRAPAYAIASGSGSDAATVGSATGTAPNLSYTVTKDSVEWGTIALNTATGAWTFTANAAALDSIDDGDSEALVLTARVTDAEGGTDEATFTITLTGAEDAASAAVSDATSDADGDDNALTFEITATDSSAATDLATITVTDPDDVYAASDFSVTRGGSADARFEVVATSTANVFTLRIKAGQSFTHDTVTAGNNTLTLAVAGPGGPFTFTGTILEAAAAPNTVPTLTVVTSDTADLAGAVTEDSSATATGSLTLADADAGDPLSTLIISTGLTSSVAKSDTSADHDEPTAPAAATAAAAGVAPDAVSGTYGSFSFSLSNAGVLTWTYTLDSTNAAVQGLRAGQLAYEKLALRVADDSGDMSETRIITVTITGANDAPEIDTGAVSASVLVHGVRFTVNEPGADGNDLSIQLNQTTGEGVRRIGNTYRIDFNANSAFDSDDLLRVWNENAQLMTRTRSPRRGRGPTDSEYRYSEWHQP